MFAVETLTEEVHDMREVGHQLSDNERDIAATAAALTHGIVGNRTALAVGADARDQWRLRPALRILR